jgi:beta-glucosidase
MRLLADAGLNTYRFGVEWARIEPAPRMISRAELAHYRRMIGTAFEFGPTPVVTLHHFTSPLSFAREGGRLGDRAVDRFRAYAEAVAPILDGVEWVVTLNEPNMPAIMIGMARAMRNQQAAGEWQSPILDSRAPDRRCRPPM